MADQRLDQNVGGGGIRGGVPADDAVAAPEIQRYVPPKLNPPDKFNFSDPSNWPRWCSRWSRYREASGLSNRPEQEQITTFVYTLGEDAEDVILSRGIQENRYVDVLNAFNEYFGVRTNIVTERAKFNRLLQGSMAMDSFINQLYRQAEECQYGVLREELIRDRLVVGVADDYLSERLQSEANLTLDVAVQMCRRHESTKQAQPLLRSTGGNASVSAVKKEKTSTRKFNVNRQAECSKCGKPGHVGHEQCPALKSRCAKCKKTGHWAKVCMSNSKVSAISSDCASVCSSSFLGTIHSSEKRDKDHQYVRVVSGTFDKTLEFKIDTGAGVSVMSPSGDLPKLMPTDRQLFGPGDTRLNVLGYINASLYHSNTGVYSKVYVVQGQRECLLSKSDSVNLGLVKFTSVETIVTSNTVTEHNDDSIGCCVDNQFKSLFQGLGVLKDRLHTIRLADDVMPHAIYAARPVPVAVAPRVEAKLKEMESEGVIEKVEEPTDWVAPMVVVPKANKDVRICADLTKLNSAVRREVHPMATVEDSISRLAKGKIFTKLDANSGYWQIRLDEKSKKLTTFLSPLGRYCYKRLPFGLSSAPEVFQREMSAMLCGLPGVVVHMDDIVVYGKERSTHDARLLNVLQRIKESGLTLNRLKCEFAVTKIKFLGRIIDGEGIHVDDSAVSGIVALPPPENLKQLQSFLGAVNQYGSFSPAYADLTYPLRGLLKKKTIWAWDANHQRAFERIKSELVNSPVLSQFDINLPITVTTDASQHGIGATLSLRYPDGTQRLVAAASRSLSDTETRYACIERECLAIMWACEKFSKYVTGLKFMIATDHKPLVPILTTKGINSLSPRLQGYRLRLEKFDFGVEYIPGAANYLADLMSRAPADNPSVADAEKEKVCELYEKLTIESLPATSPKLAALKEAQLADEVCRKVMEYCTKSWPRYLNNTDTILKPYWEAQGSLTVIEGLLLYNQRIVIPSSERLDILGRIHEGHLGISKCQERAKQSVWWPGVSTAVTDMVKSCSVCKLHSPTPVEPLLPTAWPETPWHTVGTDLFELKGVTYLLIVDYHSRYPELAKLESLTSAAVVNHMKSIFARHGIPAVIRSDNGPQYASAEFQVFAEKYDFVHITSSPRYPKANGEAERMVRTMKAMLKKCEDPYLALLAYRTTPLGNGYAPAQLLMNRELRTTLPKVELKVDPPVDGCLIARERDYRDKMKVNHDRRHKSFVSSHDHAPGDFVSVRNDGRTGVVVSSNDRSCVVRSEDSVLRRNQRDLINMSPSSVPTPLEKDVPHQRSMNRDSQKFRTTVKTPPPRSPSTRIRRGPQRYGWD